MGKVNELSQLIEELNRCGNTLIGISEELKNLFSGSEEAKETEPKTKTAEKASKEDDKNVPSLQINCIKD